MDLYGSCTLCPRRCKANRRTDRGFCAMGPRPVVARAALHRWEEPCISGSRGSGAVFFSGCSLCCAYCQNFRISHGGEGKEISAERLAEIFRELEEKGAHNINLVTPTHFVPSIIEALNIRRPGVPIVYNCGGYESPETLRLLKGYIDIYLTDIKYFDDGLSKKYSSAPGYFKAAFSAAKEMIDQTGEPAFENGLMKSGVIVRHLCLPGQRHDSIKIIEALVGLPKGSFVLSLMSQYVPVGELSGFPELGRRLTSFEYNSVVDRAVELGLTKGYIQERSSATDFYIPDFNSEGV